MFKFQKKNINFLDLFSQFYIFLYSFFVSYFKKKLKIMSISTKIRGLHIYEKEIGKIQPGDKIFLAIDDTWKGDNGTYSIQA